MLWNRRPDLGASRVPWLDWIVTIQNISENKEYLWGCFLHKFTFSFELTAKLPYRCKIFRHI